MLTGLLILLPLLFALVILFMNDPRTIKILALAGALAEFVLSLYALYIYITQCHCLLLISLDWISMLGITLRFGMDGISLAMVVLITFLMPLVIFNSWDHINNHPKVLYGLILLMEMAFVGLFTSFNEPVFYILRIGFFPGFLPYLFMELL